jgi:hypothetical protein
LSLLSAPGARGSAPTCLRSAMDDGKLPVIWFCESDSVVSALNLLSVAMGRVPPICGAVKVSCEVHSEIALAWLPCMLSVVSWLRSPICSTRNPRTLKSSSDTSLMCSGSPEHQAPTPQELAHEHGSERSMVELHCFHPAPFMPSYIACHALHSATGRPAESPEQAVPAPTVSPTTPPKSSLDNRMSFLRVGSSWLVTGIWIQIRH